MLNIEEKFEELKKWIISNGGFVNPKVNLINSEFGRTVIATDDITNERIFTLPQSLTLNPNNSKLQVDTNIFRYRESIIISLLYEYNKPNSFWTPYLNLLPSLGEFKNHPQYLQAFGKFPNLSQSITQVLEASYSEFNDFYHKFSEYNSQQHIIEKVEFKEVLWAYLCVITRMWSDVGLVPFADLLQHSNESPMSINNNDTELFMSGNFIRGSEVFDNYCVDDDLTLFFNFGFIDSSALTILPMNFLFEDSQRNINLLINALIQKLNFKKLYISSSGINTQLMRYLRLNFLDTNDLKLVDLNQDDLGLDIISLQNEIKCLKKIKYRISNFLPQEDVKFAKSSIDIYSEGSIENNILKLILRVESLRTDTLKFIDSYWMEFLGNTGD